MKKHRTIAIAAAILAGVVIVAGVMATTADSSRADAAKITARPVAVEVTAVQPSTLTETVDAIGTVAAMHDVVVSSETAGRITRIDVNVGDQVRRGQTLVQVDDELKAIAVEQAKAQLIAAETNYDKAERDFRRAEKLFAAGDIADVEIEAMRLAYHSAEAQQKTAVTGLKLAQRQLEDTRIKAPIAGIVASRRVEAGEMVTVGKEVANIVDISKIKVKVSIPEEQIGMIQRRQPTELRVDTRPDDVFRGEVWTIGSKVESPTGHSYPVEVVVDNKGVNALRVGMFARVEITLNSVQNALTISKESLVGDEHAPAVFVVENDVAKLRPVTLGIRSGDLYQVVGGLKEGDRVVSFGQKGLKDGAAVHVK